MRRIDTSTAAADENGPGRDGFAVANQSATPPVPATRLNPAWFNEVQEAICRAIELAGLTLADDDHEQLSQAIARSVTLQNAYDKSMEGSAQASIVDANGVGVFTHSPTAGDDFTIALGRAAGALLPALSILVDATNGTTVGVGGNLGTVGGLEITGLTELNGGLERAGLTVTSPLADQSVMTVAPTTGAVDLTRLESGTWAPTYTASGGLTVVGEGTYQVVGDRVSFGLTMNVSGMTASAADAFNISLPTSGSFATTLDDFSAATTASVSMPQIVATTDISPTVIQVAFTNGTPTSNVFSLVGSYRIL